MVIFQWPLNCYNTISITPFPYFGYYQLATIVLITVIRPFYFSMTNYLNLMTKCMCNFPWWLKTLTIIQWGLNWVKTIWHLKNILVSIFAPIFFLWVFCLWLHIYNNCLEPWATEEVKILDTSKEFCWPFHKSMETIKPWPFKILVVHNNYCFEGFKVFWASWIKVMLSNQPSRRQFDLKPLTLS
jgi:hypothetical protein